MPIPELIPIADEGDPHITALGRYADGMYLGFVCADGGHWIASLHTFTTDGTLSGSRLHPVPMGRPGAETGESYEAAECELGAMLATLGSRQTGDIAVRPFRVSAEGFTIELVADHEFEFADLLPVGIRFSEPWDGGYST